MKLLKKALGVFAVAALSLAPIGLGSAANAQTAAETCPADGSEITCVYFPSSGITWCYISKCGPG